MQQEHQPAEAPAQAASPPAESPGAVRIESKAATAVTEPEPAPRLGQIEGSRVAETTAQRKLAGKFDSVETLEKSYLELQQQFSSRTIDSVEALTARTGINLSETTNAYMESGKLPIAAVEAFAKAGIGVGLAERMIQGEAARVRNAQVEVERVVSQVTEIAGGAVQRDAVLNWAASTLPKDAVDGMNKRLNDPSQAVSAIRELMFMHQQAVGAGKARPLVSGMTPAASAPGYSSSSDVVAAMARVRRQGYVDEETARRLANTPRNYIEGF